MKGGGVAAISVHLNTGFRPTDAEILDDIVIWGVVGPKSRLREVLCRIVVAICFAGNSDDRLTPIIVITRGKHCHGLAGGWAGDGAVTEKVSVGLELDHASGGEIDGVAVVWRSGGGSFGHTRPSDERRAARDEAAGARGS